MVIWFLKTSYTGDAMEPRQGDVMLNTSFQSVVANNNSTPNTFIPEDLLTTAAQNTSPQNGCILMVFNEEFVPWDNPDNIISQEVEFLVSKIKNMVIAFLFLIGGPGNVINMAVFYKQGLQDRVNLCLFALALADEINISMLIIANGEGFYLQYIQKEDFKYGPFTRLLHANYFRIFFGFTYVSSILSAIIACERCHCVLRPLSHQTLMRTRTMAAIIVSDYVLVIGLFFLVVGFRLRDVCVYDPSSGSTTIVAVLTDFYIQHRAILDFVYGALIGFGFSVLVMAVVIVATIVTVVKLRQIVTWRVGTVASISSKEIALTKMLIGTSILFLICVFPTGMTRTMASAFPEMNAGRRNHNLFEFGVSVCELFIFINSSFNIVVYYVMGSRYRETFWSLFRRQLRQQDKT